MTIVPAGENPVISRERIEGRLRFIFISLTYIKDFEKVILIQSTESHSHSVRVPIMNVSDSPFYKELVAAILKQFPQEAEKAKKDWVSKQVEQK